MKEVNRIYHEYDPYKNMSDLQKEFKIMFETEQEREENNALLKKADELVKRLPEPKKIHLSEKIEKE